MQSTDQLTGDFHEEKFLLYGGSGKGKTRFIATCPRPIYIFDFDGGLRSIRGEKEIFYDTFRDTLPLYLPNSQPNPAASLLFDLASKSSPSPRSFPPATLAADPKYKRPPVAFLAFQTRWNQVITEEKWKTVAIDPITVLADYAMDEVRWQQNRTRLDTRIQDWGLAIAWVQAVMDATRDINKVVVVTAGEEVIHGTITVDNKIIPTAEETSFRPLIFGQQLPIKMPYWYDEVYRAIIQQEGPAYRYRLDTKGDSRVTAKSRMGIKERFVDSNFESLLKAL